MDQPSFDRQRERLLLYVDGLRDLALYLFDDVKLVDEPRRRELHAAVQRVLGSAQDTRAAVRRCTESHSTVLQSYVAPPACNSRYVMEPEQDADGLYGMQVRQLNTLDGILHELHHGLDHLDPDLPPKLRAHITRMHAAHLDRLEAQLYAAYMRHMRLYEAVVAAI
jgi:hypothetical protein